MDDARERVGEIARPFVLPLLDRCSRPQALAHGRYLSDTPVRTLARDLLDGRRALFTGTIVSVRSLGLLPTIFGDIGGHRPPAGRRVTFLVSEVLPLLRAHPEADSMLRQAIETCMVADAAGRLDCRATILRSKQELMLVDGNKRTIAFFERRRCEGDRIAYPIFVIAEPVDVEVEAGAAGHGAPPEWR